MPIIKSLLDTDLYKFTMSYFIWKYFPEINVRFAFTCRNRQAGLPQLVNLANLRQEVEAIRQLQLKEVEIDFLQGLGLFDDQGYFDFLRQLKLPPVEIGVNGCELDIQVKGNWAAATFWEVPVLALVNQLAAEGQMRRDGLSYEDVKREGLKRLQAKTKLLAASPLRDQTGNIVADLIEFGTRRRWSLPWQRRVLQYSIQEIPDQLIGTSNVMLARELGLKPIGTMAHELFMAMAAIMGTTDQGLAGSANHLLDLWLAEFGPRLAIALTDTFGSKTFLEQLGADRAAKLAGMRQDSGDPVEYGERLISYYQSLGINPESKKVIFSNALTENSIVELRRHFGSRIGQPKGWGTHWTFDVRLETYSIVMKLVEANGRPAVKLSDDLGKAIGNPDEVERVKKVFGYSETFSQAPIV
jgi:nicotinate phosphoribosyltransferase